MGSMVYLDKKYSTHFIVMGNIIAYDHHTVIVDTPCPPVTEEEGHGHHPVVSYSEVFIQLCSVHVYYCVL